MKELLIFIAKSLVEHPEAVEVTETEREDSVLLELQIGRASCRERV